MFVMFENIRWFQHFTAIACISCCYTEQFLANVYQRNATEFQHLRASLLTAFSSTSFDLTWSRFLIWKKIQLKIVIEHPTARHLKVMPLLKCMWNEKQVKLIWNSFENVLAFWKLVTSYCGQSMEKYPKIENINNNIGLKELKLCMAIEL